MKCKECEHVWLKDAFEETCPKCNGTGEVADKAESKSLVGHTAIKQMTIEELREQFENNISHSDSLKMDKVYPDEYLKESIQDLWSGYLWCARANNIIKE